MTRKRALYLLGLAAAVLILWWLLRKGPAEETPNRADPRRPSTTWARLRKLSFMRPTVRAASISGRVSDEHGRPVARATVCTRPRSRELAEEDVPEPRCAISGTDGRYVIPRLPPARYRVQASAPHFVPALYRTPDHKDYLFLRLGEQRTDVDLILGHGGVAVHGTVTDIGGGPIPGARVWVRSRRAWRVAAAYVRTTDAGEFTAWVAPGRIQVTANADGYAWGEVQGTAPGQHIEVNLTPESVLAGRVVEAGTNRPVARIRVSVRGEWRRGQRTSRGSAFTDEQGRFRITRLSPGRYKPKAEGLGHYGEARRSVLLELGQTVDGVLIEVHPAFRVSGRVVVAGKGTPCDKGWVWLMSRQGGHRKSGNTDQDGQVELRGVLPGKYRVRVGCADKLARDRYPDITVSGDVEGQLWEVSEGGTVQGVVVSDTTTPVPETNVRARPTGGRPRGERTWRSDRTRKDGRFRLSGLAEGTYHLEVTTHDEHFQPDPTEVTVEAGKTSEVRIELSRGGILKGDVKDEYNRPVKGATVRALGRKRWDSWRKSAITRDDGTFEIRGIRPGEYRVTARQSTGRTLRAPDANDDDIQGEEVTIKAGEEARVHLVVASQGGKITGRVVDAHGDPVKNAFVDAEREPESASAAAGRAERRMRWSSRRRPAATDLEGRFTIEHLSPGRYTVRAYQPGGGEALMEHVAVESEITLTLKQAGLIAGEVVVKGGTPPDQFTIIVKDERAGFRRSEAFFRTDGEFEMKDLPAGDFIVSVSASQGTAKERVSLSQGQKRRGVRLQLEARAILKGRVVTLDDGEPLQGFYVHAKPVKGSDNWRYGSWALDSSRRHVTDADGRFEIRRAPAGRLFVSVWPQSWSTSEYAFARIVVTARGGEVNDLGRIEVPRRKVKHKERGGDLGFKLKEQDPAADPEKRRVVVSFIRPGGPAEGSGLKVGDEIVAVNGRKISGGRLYLYWALVWVPPGTTIRLGLKRGTTISITTGEPP